MTDAITAQTRQFTITRIFDAPREIIWNAWTDPDEAPHWLHPRGVVNPRERVEYDVRVDGHYRYTMISADGREWPTAGRFREVSPHDRLVFTWGAPEDPDEVRPLITIDLAEHGAEGESTRMTFHLVGIAGAPGDDNVCDGWSEAFDGLATRVADGGER